MLGDHKLVCLRETAATAPVAKPVMLWVDHLPRLVHEGRGVGWQIKGRWAFASYRVHLRQALRVLLHLTSRPGGGEDVGVEKLVGGLGRHEVAGGGGKPESQVVNLGSPVEHRPPPLRDVFGVVEDGDGPVGEPPIETSLGARVDMPQPDRVEPVSYELEDCAYRVLVEVVV